MTYPFTPEILDKLPEELAELFRGLEDKLLEEICVRLKIAENLNEVTVQDIRALRSHGIDLEDIKKAIQKVTQISEERLKELMDDVVKRNEKYYSELIDFAKVTQPEYLVSPADIAAIEAQTLGELRNITRSMGFLVDNGRTMLPPAKAYQWALDSAELQIQSGAISYTQAISSAVKELAGSGLKIVDYESGHKDQVDVAVRRATMTGVSQLCAKYTEQTAEYLESDHYEVSAHIGARDVPGRSPWSSHKAWQGRVYSTKDGDIYPNIYEVCGLGAVDGLEGANCRHIRFVWVEGVSERVYTDEQLENIDPPPFEYDGKTYTMYQATQMQRRIERTVRKLKREKTAQDSAGLVEDAQATNIKIRRLSKKYTEFSTAANLPEQRERMKVEYVDNASIKKAAELKTQRNLEAPIREAIKRGDYPLTINPEKQARHFAETAQKGRSIITISAEELQEIINKQAGGGKILISEKSNAWRKQEIVDAGKVIGYTVKEKGEKVLASSIKIHYSNTGTHAVPYSGRWKK